MIGKLIIASILTGLISGFFIILYEFLVIFLTHLLFLGDPLKTIPTLPVWYLYLVPTVAIFIVNYLISLDKNIREYGVSEIAESIAIAMSISAGSKKAKYLPEINKLEINCKVSCPKD